MLNFFKYSHQTYTRTSLIFVYPAFFFRSVAAWLDAPDTQFLLDFIRPDFLLLRVRWFAALKGNWFSCVFSWELPDIVAITVNKEVRSCIFLVTLLIILARLPNKCGKTNSGQKWRTIQRSNHDSRFLFINPQKQQLRVQNTATCHSILTHLLGYSFFFTIPSRTFSTRNSYPSDDQR